MWEALDEGSKTRKIAPEDVESRLSDGLAGNCQRGHCPHSPVGVMVNIFKNDGEDIKTKETLVHYGDRLKTRVQV